MGNQAITTVASEVFLYLAVNDYICARNEKNS
jgi:hypothetical protein